MELSTNFFLFFKPYLFRINLSKDPYCLSCPNAVNQDVCHFFIRCKRTQYYWNWIKELIFSLLAHRNVDEVALLNYRWPRSANDREICWLMGNYVFMVWDMLYRRRLSSICEREFFGFLTFKYKEALLSNMVSEIAGI